MSNAGDMSTPVTRGELREELQLTRGEVREELQLTRSELRGEMHQLHGELRGEMHQLHGELRGEMNQFRQEIRQELREMREGFAETLARELAKLATKNELEMWGGALLARIESGEKRLKQDFTEQIEHAKRELQEDLARHSNTHHEAMRAMIAVMDDKYTDLPGRVLRLEKAVFTPRRS